MKGPEDAPAAYALVMGRLSLAGAAELERRVRAGEREAVVRLELLEREGKAIVAPALPANLTGTAP